MMVAMADQPELSVVVPVFNEEVNIVPMHERLIAALAEHVDGLEILYVDDGSADSSWQKISELAARDERVRGARFARNFGHQAALTAITPRTPEFGFSCLRSRLAASPTTG